ncbi:MAG: DUF3047 domain-containing protein [Gammaproteobacteria bacterium]
MLRFPIVLVESLGCHMSDFQLNAELDELSHYLLHPAHEGAVRELAKIDLAADQPPWQATGIKVRAGESFSIFARGRVFWAKRPQQHTGAISGKAILYGDPNFHLWARISDGGRLHNLTGDTGSFVADRDGEIELGIYMGMWADEHGNLVHTRHYSSLSGGISVILVRWHNSSVKDVLSLNNYLPTPALLVAERTRIRRNYSPPPGWQYLTATGSNEIFHARTVNGRPLINVDAHNAQGIIRYPVEIPLTDELRLHWEWRLDEHPSIGPEDQARFHDYVSVATEFDNGRDLTWIWSRHLNRDHHFHCPVKDWSQRETHYVVRTARDCTTSWVAECRNIFTDVEVSQGIPPAKIVAVWLIAVSTFSHRRLRAGFRNIHFSGDSNRVVN